MSNAEYIKTRVIKWLLEGNLSFDDSFDAIGTEVLFSPKKRSADLLILSNEFHALEIKGTYDDTRKLQEQLDDYHKTFDKVSVITVPKHSDRIYKIVKPYTGLIIFDRDTFKVKRHARLRRRLDKYSLLMFLRKKELKALSRVKDDTKLSTDEIRRKIASKLTIKKIRKAAYSSLRNRYCELFRLFMNDTGGNIIWDELRGLCGRVGDLY